jgi:hypothetical protein
MSQASPEHSAEAQVEAATEQLSQLQVAAPSAHSNAAIAAPAPASAPAAKPKSTRTKVTLESLAKDVASGKIKKIVVLTGAGISCSAGIPDFRSPGTGLYDNLQKYNLPRPTAVFELEYFRRNPKPFYLVRHGNTREMVLGLHISVLLISLLAPVHDFVEPSLQRSSTPARTAPHRRTSSFVC